MPYRVTTIKLPRRSILNPAQCYLIQADVGYVLIDTGPPRQRAAVVAGLTAAGCTPGTLSLILLTHGDFDHAGNAAYLREAYGAPLAMHKGDVDMLAHGDLSAGRRPNLPVRLAALAGPLLLGFGRGERCTPDLTFDDGDSLAAYGLDARVLALGGHSAGSLGLLVDVASGSCSDLFCGDLLSNIHTPKLGWWLPDPEAARAAIRRLRQQSIRTVYPGHGAPFPFDALPHKL